MLVTQISRRIAFFIEYSRRAQPACLSRPWFTAEEQGSYIRAILIARSDRHAPIFTTYTTNKANKEVTQPDGSGASIRLQSREEAQRKLRPREGSWNFPAATTAITEPTRKAVTTREGAPPLASIATEGIVCAGSLHAGWLGVCDRVGADVRVAILCLRILGASRGETG